MGVGFREALGLFASGHRHSKGTLPYSRRFVSAVLFSMVSALGLLSLGGAVLLGAVIYGDWCKDQLVVLTSLAGHMQSAPLCDASKHR